MEDSFLLYRDSSSEGKKPYFSRHDIIKDLNLDIVFRTMSRGDVLISENVNRIMMLPLKTPEQVLYRQAIIKDFHNNEDLIEAMYECVLEQQKALATFKEETEKNRTRQARKASQIIETLNYLGNGQDGLVYIKNLLAKYKDKLKSEGLNSLLKRLMDLPLEQIKEKLQDMDFFVSGGETGYTFQFGGGFKITKASVNYCRAMGRVQKKQKQGGFKKFYDKYIKKNSMQINNNEELQKDVEYLEEFTLQQILRIFQPYLSEMMAFYSHFTEEISFYKGVFNIMKRMEELGIKLVMPEPAPAGSKDTEFKNLYELPMAVYMQRRPVGNSISLCNNILTLVTGANQGGKSTFLRSYGVAQVLMQCGMPVSADHFMAQLYKQVFTHFTRKGDEQLNSGRLQEELKRMSEMVQAAEPHSIFLLNESFASTTEKEGSQIADGILHAFYDKEITTIMVTHLFQLARSLYNKKIPCVEFLIAERKDDGTRTFKMMPGKPEYTSYGTDLFNKLWQNPEKKMADL